MALMYDMETVNKAMAEAAKLYDPKRPSIRVKRVLDIFAGMKPVEVEPVAHGTWKPSPYTKKYAKCTVCEFTRDVYTQIGWKYCPHCGAIMDGRPEK